jgi:hypothetical protein
MDTTQLLLTIILTVSTIFVVIIGIQLILVLKELRKSLKNINTIIDGFESIGVGLEHGLAEIVGFFNGFRTVTKVLDVFSHKKNEKKQTD